MIAENLPNLVTVGYFHSTLNIYKSFADAISNQIKTLCIDDNVLIKNNSNSSFIGYKNLENFVFVEQELI